MGWHEFVFTEKKPQRYARHVAFWLLWWIYFFFSLNFFPQQANALQKTQYTLQSLPDIIYSLLIVFIHILSCYVLIYLLIPRYLLKSKYLLFVAGTIVLGFVMVQATRFIDTVIMPFFNSNSKNPVTPYFVSIYSGLLNAIKILAAATALKLIKRWYHTQKEKQRLEREKIEAELDLLKSHIHPGFLFNTLNNIYSFALTSSPKAPQMLLKLSDILSYMLYECNEKEVPLDKEIRLLEDYIALEKMRYGNKLEVNMQVRGDTSKDSVAPLLLLGFIENSFKQSSNKLTTQPWLNLALGIEHHVLTMKLMSGKPLGSLSADDSEEPEFEQIQRRLGLLYPGRYKLKIKEEAEIMMIVLQLRLQSASIEFEWTMQKEILESAED